MYIYLSVVCKCALQLVLHDYDKYILHQQQQMRRAHRAHYNSPLVLVATSNTTTTTAVLANRVVVVVSYSFGSMTYARAPFTRMW